MSAPALSETEICYDLSTNWLVNTKRKTNNLKLRFLLLDQVARTLLQMVKTPKVFPAVKCWTPFENCPIFPCLYLSRGQNPCWQTTQTSSGGTFAPRSTVLGGGWIHWTGSKRFTRSVTQRCFSPFLWFSSHSFSERCTSQLSQLWSRLGPKMVAFCLLRQLSRREAGEEAEAWAIKLWLNFKSHILLTWMTILPGRCHKQLRAAGFHFPSA